MLKRIDYKETLIQAMKKGINLFVGAGFSVYAKDSNGVSMPVGERLIKELHKNVGAGLSDLPRYCSVMERKNRSALYNYLTNRFHVDSFDDSYLNLNLINIKGVYTTNIDDLIPQIIAQNPNRYINEQNINGDCANSQGINYLPLHGYIKYPENGYIFSVEKIASIYNQTPRIWSYLSAAIEKYPTLFIGYGLNDTGVIESIMSQQTFANAQKSMWIVLYNPSPDDIEYFEGVGFNIIIADTKEFLDEIPLMGDLCSVNSQKTNTLEKVFPANVIPKDSRGLTQRPIEEFYRGMPPNWADILRNVIYRTSFYKDIENSVFSKKHTIIIGAPISGKTTLAMQVGEFINFDGTKLMFNDLNVNKAEYIAKIVGKQKALIIIENFSDDVDAFMVLKSLPNAKVIGIDRSHYFAIVSHKFVQKEFDIINVTELKQQDIQGIIDAIPEGIRRSEREIKRKKDNSDRSIFEFVIRHVKGQTIKNRYRDFIIKLESENPELAEFLVLCAYMHVSRVPLSMEVAYSYFDEKNYKEVMEMRKQLSDFLQEDDEEELATNNIDGYRPRSSIVADAILEYTSKDLLAHVMWNVLDKVNYVSICNYNKFRRWAFDKALIMRAFPKWQEGKEFYEDAFLFDNRNPYILQQGALYLSAKKHYNEAFDWIDKAKTMTNDRQFSIRNSHAVILFDANYEVTTMEAESLMDNSMEILHKCYNDDKRRTFHAKTYADQALRYFRKYHNDKAKAYLEQAKVWLNDEIKENSWEYELKSLYLKVNETISLL